MEIRTVEIQDILAARDMRVRRQTALLQRDACPVVCLTMNVAGPIKLDDAILYAFREGMRRVEAVCAETVRERVLSETFTGCEAIWAADLPVEELKTRMTAIENADALGRLFDLDVLDIGGEKISRREGRRCLICDAPAFVCARSRAHSTEELFARTHEIIHCFAVGRAAERALLREVECSPKPGLVDAEDNGAHHDMNIETFRASAHALRPYFEEAAQIGVRMRGESDAAIFAELQNAGISAESTMLEATGGVNTHKGAIFLLGLLCCASGICGENPREEEIVNRVTGIRGENPHEEEIVSRMTEIRGKSTRREEIVNRAAALARISLEKMMRMRPEDARTAGERQYFEQGLTGVRGQAAAGFPDAVQIALPVLEAKPENPNDAGLEALLKLMTRVNDSNLLHRGGTEGLRYAQSTARRLLETGYNKDDLRRMNADFKERNLSPGGSADLLAVAYFLQFIRDVYKGE